jgi:transcriptional regulator with XRE-family HTH domain
MTHRQYDASSKEARILRAHAGDYVKQLRIAAGLTQRQLADALGLEWYSFISQLETGHGRLPPNLYVKTAKALKQDVKQFSLKMLEFYDPWTAAAINGSEWKDSDVEQNRAVSAED